VVPGGDCGAESGSGTGGVPPNLLEILAVAPVVFAATNIDDIVILALFFADARVPPRSIVVGQFLGLGTLTLASGLLALTALVVPPGWPALLGIAPLAIGLWKLRALFGPRADCEEAQGTPSTRGAAISVALVTLANGGDNLGVYVPLFASEPRAFPIYGAVFGVMTALWCFAGWALVRHRAVRERIARWGHVALPFVLIALGLLILRDALVLLPTNGL